MKFKHTYIVPLCEPAYALEEDTFMSAELDPLQDNNDTIDWDD